VGLWRPLGLYNGLPGLDHNTGVYEVAKKTYQNVEEYLADLDDSRRELVSELFRVMRDNADPKLECGIQYGMPALFVPHRHYPAGYHCDPKAPLPFASVAATKAGASVYLFCSYCDQSERARVAEEWKATGHRLDMGKSCIRVRKLEQVPLEVLGRAVNRMDVPRFIAAYERSVPASRR
jgi:hypothetical protein